MLLSPCNGSNSGIVVSFYSRQAYFYCLQVSLGLALDDTLSETPPPLPSTKHEYYGMKVTTQHLSLPHPVLFPTWPGSVDWGWPCLTHSPQSRSASH